MIFSPAPKPLGRLDQDERTARQVQKILDRKRQRKPLRAKKWLARGTKPIPQRNAKRAARREKSYRAHLRSAYWHSLLVAAYRRDGGLCQCDRCIQGRKDGEAGAFEQMEIWFDTKGRIHGFDTHHVTYVRFGHELLSDVLTMTPSHHRYQEAKSGLRKAFLRGKRV